MNSQTSAFIHYGNFLFKYRNIVFPVVLIFLLIVFRPGLAFGGSEYDIYLNLIGISITVSGALVRALVIGLAYIKRGGLNKKVYADNLVTSGIFSHCRNPLYLGNLLIIFGLLVVHNNYWVYIIGIAFMLLSYSAIVQAEELFLRDKFKQEYDDYCRHAGRWMFNFHGLRATFSQMEFNWRRVILKDYSTMLSWTIALNLILAGKTVALNGFENSSYALINFSSAIAILLIIGLCIRFLKKSGRLTEDKFSLHA